MRLLLSLILMKALLLILYLQLPGAPGLVPDEAQYWTWSQDLALGYFSKPPLIAYLIALTTAVVGNTVLGVKVVGIIIGSLLPLAVYALGRAALLEEKSAQFAALGVLLSPLGFFSAFYATTDGPMVLFWTLALTAWMVAKEESYLGPGLFVLLGALVKWPAYLLWLLFLPFVRNWRRFFKGVLLSFVALIPPLIWNIQHGFPTFRHVAATAVGGSIAKAPPNPLDFFGAQAFLMSPLLFLLFLFGFLYWREVKSFSIRFLGGSSLFLLFAYLAASFFQKIQGNWAVFLYPGAFIFTAAIWKNERLRFAALLIALCSSLLLFALPFLPIPLKMNPFKEALGWEKIGKVLEKVQFDPAKEYLVAPSYQLTSLLSFYGETNERAYLLSVPGRRLCQFDFWPLLRERENNRSGIFVATSEKERWEKELPEIFREVKPLGSYPLLPGKELTLFRVKGLEHEPCRSSSY